MNNSKRRKRDAGVAFVEFALASLTILLLLFGIIDVGRALYAYDWVCDAARQGTRWAMVRGQDCSGLSGGCPAGPDDVTTYVKSLGVGIDTSRVTVDTECIGPSISNPPPCSNDGPVRITVHYGFHFISPLAFQSWTMSSTSQRAVLN